MLNFSRFRILYFFVRLKTLPCVGMMQSLSGECFLWLFLLFSIKESSSAVTHINKSNGIK